MSKTLLLEVFLLTTAMVFVVAHAAITMDMDMNLKPNQKAALEKFKERMLSKVDADYKKKDTYLVRWLRAKQFDVDKAEDLLNEDMKWRKDKKIDKILEEDWSTMEKHVPFDLEGIDKDGRPMSLTHARSINYNAAILASGGTIEKINRYYIRLLEIMDRKIRKLQEDGKKITRFHYIVSLDGFNSLQHTCVTCLGIYSNLAKNYVNHYPMILDRIIHVNSSPELWNLVLEVVKPELGTVYDQFETYGYNKDQWEKKLAEIAEPNQLTQAFGGTRKGPAEKSLLTY